MQAKPTGREQVVELLLFVSNKTPKSVRAYANLKRICEQNMPGKYSLEVIDILKQPQIARQEQIVAIPMVVRRRPLPVRTVIGDLSNVETTLAGLELRTTDEGAEL